MPHVDWAQWGIAGVVIGVLFVILWRILVWVMAFIKDMTKQHNDERITWLAALNALNQSIVLHNLGSIEARKMTEEAHKYQKDEHEKLAKQNNDICLALGRLNGYKNDGE